MQVCLRGGTGQQIACGAVMAHAGVPREVCVCGGGGGQRMACGVRMAPAGTCWGAAVSGSSQSSSSSAPHCTLFSAPLCLYCPRPAGVVRLGSVEHASAAVQEQSLDAVATRLGGKHPAFRDAEVGPHKAGGKRKEERWAGSGLGGGEGEEGGRAA